MTKRLWQKYRDGSIRDGSMGRAVYRRRLRYGFGNQRHRKFWHDMALAALRDPDLTTPFYY